MDYELLEIIKKQVRRGSIGSLSAILGNRLARVHSDKLTIKWFSEVYTVLDEEELLFTEEALSDLNRLNLQMVRERHKSYSAAERRYSLVESLKEKLLEEYCKR